MAEIASAYVALLPSAKGMGEGITHELGDAGAKGGKSAARGFKGSFAPGIKGIGGMLAGVFAASKGVDFLKDAVGQASDLSESSSKVKVVFKDQAGAIENTAKTAASAMGLSKGAYLDAAGGLGNLLVSLKIAPKAAAGMSQRMVALAGDLASFNNTSPEEALDALKSGLTGETEPLKRYGVNMNDATLKAQALKDGLIKTTKQALTPQQKALAAQALIMGQTKTAQGDFARTSGGLANQQRILAAKVDDVKSKVGTALLPILTKFANYTNDKILPAVQGFITGMQNGTGPGGRLAGVVGHIRDALSDALPYVRKVIGFLVNNKEAVATFAGVILTVAAAIKVWSVVQAALDIALSANPLGLVVIAVAALAAGLVYAYKHSETFRDIVHGALHAVGAAGRWLWNNVFSRVFKFILNGIASIIGGFAKMLHALGHVPGFGWAKKAGDAMDTAAGKARDMADGIKKIKDKKVKVQVNYHVKGATPATQRALAKDRSLSGARAAGGPVMRGKTYLVGEHGPELFKPVASGTIIPNHKASRGEPWQATASTRGGLAGPQFHVDKVEAQDVNHFLRQMQSRGRAVSGGGVSF